ncbi:hypothetical protein LJC49_11010 [Ruminococcaceae bacterium OttesenSCG-928-I18]|nr:hypothetical protein [Ruminococcaceae bacterium OttesenSCG-928-I18]
MDTNIPRGLLSPVWGGLPWAATSVGVGTLLDALVVVLLLTGVDELLVGVLEELLDELLVGV